MWQGILTWQWRRVHPDTASLRLEVNPAAAEASTGGFSCGSDCRLQGEQLPQAMPHIGLVSFSLLSLSPAVVPVATQTTTHILAATVLAVSTRARVRADTLHVPF